jgi:enterochelin esterase-like enzyme
MTRKNPSFGPSCAAPALLLVAVACGGSSALLERRTVDSDLLGRAKEFAVLRAPPAAGVDPATLPVVLLLHGMGDDHRSLDRFGLSERLHAAMEAGSVPCAHFVMPDGERGFWLDWHDGSRPWERYVLEEVLPAGEALLGVEGDRERRHLMGVSMGGIGALQTGLRHPELFASVTSLSGLILDPEGARDFLHTAFVRHFVDLTRVFGDGTDEAYLDAWNPYRTSARRAPDLGQRIFLAAGSGEDEKFRRTTTAFHQHLAKLGVEHAFEIYEGKHGWKWWAPVIERALAYVMGG